MKKSKHITLAAVVAVALIALVLAIIGVFVKPVLKATAWLVVILFFIAWLVFAFGFKSYEDGVSDDEKAICKKQEKFYMISSLVLEVVAIIILLLSCFGGIGATAPTKIEEPKVPETTTAVTDVPIDSTKPSDTSTSKPAGTKPAGTKSEGTKPAGTKSEGTKPEGTTKPTGTKPTGTKPEGTTKLTGTTDAHQHKVANYKNEKVVYELNGSKHYKIVRKDGYCSCDKYMGTFEVSRTAEAHSGSVCVCGYKEVVTTTKPETTKPTTTKPETTTTTKPTEPPHEHKVARETNYQVVGYEKAEGGKHLKLYQGVQYCECSHNMGKGEILKEEEAHSFKFSKDGTTIQGKCACGDVKGMKVNSSRYDDYDDPAMGPNDTVTLSLSNVNVDDVNFRWSKGGSYRTDGVSLNHLYGDVYELTLSGEIWECAADIEVSVSGCNDWITVTLEPQY